MSLRKEIEKYIKQKYDTDPEYTWAKLPDYATFKAKENDKWFALVAPVDRKRMGLSGDGMVDVINVKAEPEFIAVMAGTDGFLPAYHMNKRHWISILLDDRKAFEKVADCIDISYNLVTDSPTKRIYEAVKKIPKGSVATYGDVAAMAGEPKMARAVGNALHKNPNPNDIPCYRVVNSKGELAGKYVFGGRWEQAKLLEADGIKVVDGKVDLKRYRIVL